MAIDEGTMRAAVEAISNAPGLVMDENDLVEDVFLLAYAFPEPVEFQSAVVSTVRAIAQLASDKVDASQLAFDFEDWRSYHYQHRAAQGVRATCRIVFRPHADGTEVKGFGNRHIPENFYRRLRQSRR